MQSVELKCGDVFLEYSNRKIAKLVMFLMQEPTIWSWLYHKIFGGMNEVNFYHAGMILSPTISIEQQKVVIANKIRTNLFATKIVYQLRKN